jgi:hypothetical protein
MNARLILLITATSALLSVPAFSQAPAAARANQAPPLAPATKLEAFEPAAGSVLTLGYSELGTIGSVSVDVREMRDGRAAAVRGLVVEVKQSQYQSEKAFVDADEIPELLKGIDALLDVHSNPTAFVQFEVRYTTRGKLQITAYNSTGNAIRYAVQAGRITHASTFVDEDGLRKLRGMFEAAQKKLSALAAK